MKFVAGIRRAKKWIGLVLLLIAVAAVSGCRAIGFYAQAMRGQFQIIARRQRIERLIADPETPARLREQLKLLERLRAFAETELKLPVDDHYRKYTDVGREYVVWNVQAAPRFSLQPKTWWYPIVGSLEYRGYFSERGATNEAARLAARGYDVYSDGVEAYSTLGWFKDPVLNTFIFHAEPDLAELIFHELGHQRVFARGDTDFNEAFATTVGQEGARRWLRAQGDTNQYNAYLAALRRDDQFVHLVMKTRERLEAIYGDQRDEDGNVVAAKKSPLPPDEMQRAKEQVFADLRRDYAELKTQWGGDTSYDNWFARELNNAKLNTIANYFDYVPGFERLLELHGGNLEEFYQAAERLAKMPQEERHQWLRDLQKGEKVKDIEH
jgi:predicted aminopeptidase